MTPSSRSTTSSALSVSRALLSTRRATSPTSRVTILLPSSWDPSLTPNPGYMKAVKAALQEKNAPAETITAFEKGAQAYVKEHLLPNFKDFEFYTGESMNPDGMYVFYPTILSQAI